MGNNLSESAARILPGDVVQIISEASAFVGLFGTVEAVRNWGAVVSLPRPGDTEVPIRLAPEHIRVIGEAAIMKPEIRQARDTLKATLAKASAETIARKLSGRPVVMQLAGMPDGSRTGLDGQYLEDFDFEAFEGTGNVVLTKDIRKAKQFASLADAMTFRDVQPQCKPFRDDGLPNRPMTATTWAIVPADEGEAH